MEWNPPWSDKHTPTANRHHLPSVPPTTKPEAQSSEIPAGAASDAKGWRAFSVAVPWSTDRLGEIGGVTELGEIAEGPVSKAVVVDVFCIQQQADNVIIDGVMGNVHGTPMRFVLRGRVRDENCTLGQNHRRFIVLREYFVKNGGGLIWESALAVHDGCAVLPFPRDPPSLSAGCDAIDLFSGTGGGHLALESAGFQVAAAVDNGAACAKWHHLFFSNNHCGESLRRRLQYMVGTGPCCRIKKCWYYLCNTTMPAIFGHDTEKRPCRYSRLSADNCTEADCLHPASDVHH